MGFFDFVTGMPQYLGKPQNAQRLNLRHDMLIAPFRDDIAGARVLDLGAHDGRWSYAFAAAGAAEVVGIEARADLVARFAAFPDPALRARVQLIEADLFDHLETASRNGERFDLAAVFGVFYHIMDHNRLLLLLRRLGARLIVIDGEFLRRGNPMIQLILEETGKVLNAAPQYPGQAVAVKGVPSRNALETMAETLGYDVTWLPWDGVPPALRGPVRDYFRDDDMRRATCALRRF